MATRQVVLISTFTLLLGVFLARLPATLAAISGEEDWPAAMAEVRQLITDRYVEPVDENQLIRDGIRGMTDSLNDPYTEFVPPADREDFEKDLTGQFVGIGAAINTRDGWLYIVHPLEDSPALRAGLRPGDVVKTIDGETTFQKTPDECVARIKGEPGTPVTLQIERQVDGKPQLVEVSLRRGEIAPVAAKGYRFDAANGVWDFRLDPERALAYVRLTQFTPGAAQQLKTAIRSATSKGDGPEQPRGLILDLRDNPGGLLDEAVGVVRLFLDSGVIVSTRGRSDRAEVTRARGDAPFATLPLVVIVNENSASASEVVAGALADNKRALVVGARSFGKGVVQRIEPVRSLPGAQLKLTEQHYYLPSGRLLHRTDDAKTWGVDPSPGFFLPLNDEQRLAALKVRRAMDLIRPPDAPVDAGLTPDIAPSAPLYGDHARWTDADWIERDLNDRQLAAALRAMQHHFRHHAWPEPAGDAPSPDGVHSGVAAGEILRLDRARERLLREAARIERRLIALEGGDLAHSEANRPKDLWPDSLDLGGGKITVTDKQGRVISLLDITGPDLERWLLDADVRPAPDSPSPARDAASEKPADRPPNP